MDACSTIWHIDYRPQPPTRLCARTHYTQAYDCSKHPAVLQGRQTKEECLRDFMRQFEKGTADGVITRAEFLDYYADISAGWVSGWVVGWMERSNWSVKRVVLQACCIKRWNWWNRLVELQA